MSSWFSGLGETLRQSTKAAVVKTKEVTAKAQEKVKVRLGKLETASELEQILEDAASTTLAADKMAHLHKEWVEKINRKDGPSYGLFPVDEVVEDASPERELHKKSSRETALAPGAAAPASAEQARLSKATGVMPTKSLAWKQVFLRSQALEYTILNVLNDPGLRTAMKAPEPGDTSSGAYFFYTLLQNTISCPPLIWTELLKLAVEAEFISEFHIQFLVRIFGVLKVDWKDEFYHTERKDMAVRAEQLRNDIRGVRVSLPNLSDEEMDKQHRKKTLASKELVQLYQALRENMENALTHRQVSLRKRQDKVKLLFQEMDEYKLTLGTDKTSTEEGRKKLEVMLTAAAGEFGSTLSGMDEERMKIDEEIEVMEAQKAKLKQEIEAITQKILEARDRQRKYMQDHDGKRTTMYNAKSDLKAQIQATERKIADCEKGSAILESMAGIVEKTESQVLTALNRQITELSKKREQFDTHFVEVLRDHSRYEDDRLTTISEQSKASLARLTAMGEVELMEPGNKERTVFMSVTNQLDDIWADITIFQTSHKIFIDATPALSEIMQKMEEKYRAVKSANANMVQLIATSSGTVQRASGMTGPPPPPPPPAAAMNTTVGAPAMQGENNKASPPPVQRDPGSPTQRPNPFEVTSPTKANPFTSTSPTKAPASPAGRPSNPFDLGTTTGSTPPKTDNPFKTANGNGTKTAADKTLDDLLSPQPHAASPKHITPKVQSADIDDLLK